MIELMSQQICLHLQLIMFLRKKIKIQNNNLYFYENRILSENNNILKEKLRS